jgi:anti-sigma factor RsiW
MKCERAQAWFSDYIDGSIQPAEKVVLEAHLGVCPDCAEEVRRLTALWTALDRMPDVAAPVSLRATIWQRIEAQSAQAETASGRPSKPRRPLWIRGLAFAGAAAVLALLATVSVPGKYRPAALGAFFGRFRASSEAAQCMARVSQRPDGLQTVSVTIQLPEADIRSAAPITVTVLRGNTTIAETRVTPSDGHAVAVLELPEKKSGDLTVRVQWTGADGHMRQTILPSVP